MPKAVLVNKKDNVAVVIEAVERGEEIRVETGEHPPVILAAATDLPIYHKVALQDIKKGSAVMKYGEEIGVATEDIPKGSHVHVHNVTSRSLLTE